MPEVFTQSDPPKLIETGEELAQKLQAPLIQLTTHKDLISKGEDDAEEENLIVGTNTPRAKRSSAYYDLLCAESAVRGVEQAVSYQDDFTTDAVQDAGLHTAAAQLIVEGNAVTAVADSAVVLGDEAKAVLRDMRDGTLDAKDALHSGGKVLRLQGGKAVVRVGAAAGRSAERYAASFRTSAEDFADSAPNQIKDTALQTWRTAGGIKTLAPPDTKRFGSRKTAAGRGGCSAVSCLCFPAGADGGHDRDHRVLHRKTGRYPHPCAKYQRLPQRSPY